MHDDTETEWRPIPDYEAQYEVSPAGDIRRCGRAARTGKGQGGGATIGRILKPSPVPGGYRKVQLWRNGSYQSLLVHRIVAAAFLGPRPEGHEVNHKDGDKTNNRVGNLEYMTRSENNRHAYRTGLRTPLPIAPSGAAHHNAKLTDEQVREIRRLYRPRMYGTPRLAREFGVSHKTIWQIVRGNAWKETV